MKLNKADVVKKAEEKLVELLAGGEVDVMHTESMLEVYERELAGLGISASDAPPSEADKGYKSKIETEIENLRKALKIKKDLVATAKVKALSLEITLGE